MSEKAMKDTIAAFLGSLIGAGLIYLWTQNLALAGGLILAMVITEIIRPYVARWDSDEKDAEP